MPKEYTYGTCSMPKKTVQCPKCNCKWTEAKLDNEETSESIHGITIKVADIYLRLCFDCRCLGYDIVQTTPFNFDVVKQSRDGLGQYR